MPATSDKSRTTWPAPGDARLAGSRSALRLVKGSGCPPRPDRGGCPKIPWPSAAPGGCWRRGGDIEGLCDDVPASVASCRGVAHPLAGWASSDPGRYRFGWPLRHRFHPIHHRHGTRCDDAKRALSSALGISPPRGAVRSALRRGWLDLLKNLEDGLRKFT